MPKRPAVWLVALLLVVLLAVLLIGFFVVPGVLYPPFSASELNDIVDTKTRIELRQAQSKLQNDFRSNLLQGLAGLLLVAGAVATWRQLQITRDGQITERFTRAIEQVGSKSMDVRIGGIYALERIGINSVEDRRTIQYILGSLVRRHAHWSPDQAGVPQDPAITTDDTMSWVSVRAPDIQAAVSVLGRRFGPAATGPLYLPRVDLRGVRLTEAMLTGTRLQQANLTHAWLGRANLDRTDLTGADLRQAHAADASFVSATLRDARFEGADLQGANLRGADLRGADMRALHLDTATFTDARIDDMTIWPPEFTHRLRELGLNSSGADTDGPS